MQELVQIDKLWNRLFDVTVGVLLGGLGTALLLKDRCPSQESPGHAPSLKEMLLATELREARKSSHQDARIYPIIAD